MVKVGIQTHMVTQIPTEMEAVDPIRMAMEAVELMDQVLTVMVDQTLKVEVLDEEVNLKSVVPLQSK